METGRDAVPDESEDRGGFLALGRERCVSLTTFRCDGTPVATPVFVVTDGTRLFVHTGASTGKVKRLRHNPRVQIAACTSRGIIHGPVFDAEASISNDLVPVERLIACKYGSVVRVLNVLYGLQRAILRRPKTGGVALVIKPI